MTSYLRAKSPLLTDNFKKSFSVFLSITLQVLSNHHIMLNYALLIKNIKFLERYIQIKAELMTPQTLYSSCCYFCYPHKLIDSRRSAYGGHKIASIAGPAELRMQGVLGSDALDRKFPQGNTELVLGVVKCPIHVVTFILISILNIICYMDRA